MPRWKLPSTLLVSLVLHALVGGWLFLRTGSERPAAASPPLEVRLWMSADTPRQAPRPAPGPRAPIPQRAKVAAHRELHAVSPPPPAAAPEEGAAGEADSSAGSASDVPCAPRISLFPQLSLAPGGDFAALPSRGHTVYPDDPSLSPEALRAEEEHRVGARVGGWTEDTLAEARAQRGLPHPYFSGVGEAARAGLEREARAQKVGATLIQAAAAFGQRYAEAVESYGKGGNPDLGPPGIAPRLSERTAERFGNEPGAMPLRALVQATELQSDLRHGRPLISLTLELRQSKDRKTQTAAVLQGSSDPKFDAFVLGAWPKAIEEAGPPPVDAFHGQELRSVWAVEGWLGLPRKLDKVLSYLPTPGVYGLPLDAALPAVSGEGYHYEFRARLLRVY